MDTKRKHSELEVEALGEVSGGHGRPIWMGPVLHRSPDGTSVMYTSWAQRHDIWAHHWEKISSNIGGIRL